MKDTPGETVRVCISVRNLVEFILRSGDIDNRSARIDTDAMSMGRKLHQKIQRRGGPSYQAEVALSRTTDFARDGFSLTVEGRADGIISGKDGYTIDEIKGMYRDVNELTEPVPVHLAQAKCYAYMWLCKVKEEKKAPAEGKEAVEGLAENITVQMTYVNLETEQVRRLRQKYTFKELEDWYKDLTGRYRRWALYTVSHGRSRRKSIRMTEFPYPYREGQRKLAAAVYRTIEQKKKLFIQAPTGSGKTLATVFPAVRAIGEGFGDRIFYLTARTITRTVAEDCFRLLENQGLDFRVVTITSKEKICPVLEKDAGGDVRLPCNPQDCPCAEGHYDRVNEVIYSLLTGGSSLHREDILKAAMEHKVCPFELTLDLTDWTDGVICDYNYLFDPTARLQRFFGAGSRGDYIFLVDEAHNLVDRGRDMYSADLYREEFLAARLSLKKARAGAALQKTLSACLAELLQDKKHFLEEEDRQGRPISYLKMKDAGELPALLMNLSAQTEDFLQLDHSRELSQEILSFYFRIQEFLGALDRFSDKYVLTERIAPDGRFQVRAACLDPSTDLQACMDKGRAAVLFSATLLPIRYYKSLLSEKTDDYAIYASSVFDPKRRRILIGADVSTRYQDRGPETYRKIAEYIRAVVQAKDGNYMVFFSSYRMMEDVEQEFEKILPGGTRLLLQKSGMAEDEREEFLRAFSEENSEKKTLVGFCVMGSFFGEGIDLKGKSLIGAIVVGAGLPQVGAERELLKDYFDQKGMDGFFYSYMCPGLAKVLQAAGRVIRTETDRGVIVLIDSRFTRKAYRDLFPREWADAEYVTLTNISLRLEQFWKTV